MRRKLPYPRDLAPFPRYHPPYPIPYVVEAKPRNYTVYSQRPNTSYGFRYKTYPQSGYNVVQNPYIYENPYYSQYVSDIRYNTIEPLVQPIPYTYGFERGFNHRRGNRNMPTEQMTQNTTSGFNLGGFLQKNPQIIGQLASSLSQTAAVNQSKASRPQPSPTQQKKITNVKIQNILKNKTALLTNMPPRVVNRYAQQAQMQMAAFRPMMANVPAVQSQQIDKSTAKKEKTNTALIATAIATPFVLLGGFSGVVFGFF